MLQPPTTATLPLSRIKPGDNPRRYFDPKKHDELVASLRMRGMLQPLLLRPTPGDADAFTLVAGGRRYRAAVEAFGADGAVPVIVRDMTDQEALEAAIDENDIRDDASETEQADAAARALVASGNDRAEAARRLGWPLSKLDRRLALANLSDAVKRAVDERRIRIGHAELLAAVPPDKQDKALDTIVTAGLDVTKTRELLMRVTQSLAAATFDKTECMTCPFNSASQRALFATHVEDGHCTNPGCYQLKTEAAQAGADLHIRGDQLADAPDAPPPAVKPSGADAAPIAPVAPAAANLAPARPAASPATTPRPAAVTTETLAKKLAGIREAAWREAIVAATASDPDVRAAFEASLRASWQIDKAFLDRLTKDELRFVAQECGLVAHMGARPFAKLLDGKPAAIVAGMLNAKGFNWAGRLPSALTLDGKYGPPPAAAPLAYKD